MPHGYNTRKVGKKASRNENNNAGNAGKSKKSASRRVSFASNTKIGNYGLKAPVFGPGPMSAHVSGPMGVADSRSALGVLLTRMGAAKTMGDLNQLEADVKALEMNAKPRNPLEELLILRQQLRSRGNLNASDRAAIELRVEQLEKKLSIPGY